MTKTIAVPTVAGKACQHFGHCERFAIIEVSDGAVTSSCMVTPPAHQPGLYPRFLAEQGVTVVLAGGMGQKALDLFAQQGIEVLMGMPPEDPTALADSLGLTLGAAVQVNAGSADRPPVPIVRADAMAMSDAETYSAGDLTVTASVSVVFEASP